MQHSNALTHVPQIQMSLRFLAFTTRNNPDHGGRGQVPLRHEHFLSASVILHANEQLCCFTGILRATGHGRASLEAAGRSLLGLHPPRAPSASQVVPVEQSQSCFALC